MYTDNDSNIIDNKVSKIQNIFLAILFLIYLKKNVSTNDNNTNTIKKYELFVNNPINVTME